MAFATPTFPSTKETTNYARLCRLLVDVGSQVLRDTFDKIHPPANLYAVLSRPAVHAALQSLQKRKVLNPTQWGKLYPAIKSFVSSRDFDITLLMVLLRNISGLVPPVTGWDNLPSAADVAPEADIARVKFYRNTVYGHASQASVDDAAFGTYWTEIRDALVRLGGADYGAAIDDLKDDCMDPDIEEHYQELLKQWKKDEDNFKDKLDEVAQELSQKLNELKTSMVNAEGKTQMNDPLDLKECQSQLCSHYNTMSQVKITPWDPDDTVVIDEVYTKLSWLRDERKPSGKTQRELEDYTEMFDGHKRFANPKRMLVYGRPGIGKSTFSQKIAFDWANKKNETLKRFDLLLFIKLRDVCGIQDLPSIFKASKLLATDGLISVESLYEYVLQNQDKVLLVLDGYDEYSAERSSPIREIWEGNQLRDCHVVVTTRQMEGEELIKSSHVQCEIKGFNSKEQVNAFASKFITDQREIEEFDRYLTKVKLWDIAEIPLLLLMLCLIWNNRHCKELPTSTLKLHERFVETLLCHMSSKEPGESPLHTIQIINILDDCREELSSVGKLALDALLRNTLYVDLKEVSTQSSVLTGKMIRSGLVQFSKLSSADPNKSIFFLHKSVQEFLAAWYIMNEAGLKEEKVDCFARVDSFDKVSQLKEILKFMCEWSVEGAKAVFSLLKFVGEKEGLTECCFTVTPCLSAKQRQFRDLSLECLLSCPSEAKPVMYPLFLSCVGGVVSVSYRNIRKVADEHLLTSSSAPSYIFFEGQNLPVSIMDDLKASVITCSGRRLVASKFIQKHIASELEPEHFFLKKEGEEVYLYFTIIYLKYSTDYLRMLEELSSPPPQKTRLNCLSLVCEVHISKADRNEDLTIVSNILSAVASPQRVSVVILSDMFRSFVPRVVRKMVSNINMTGTLCRLKLGRLNITADDVAVIATSLRYAPNLHELDFSDCPLYEGVSRLVENLHHVPRLSKLRLSRVGMGEQEGVLLATAFHHVPELAKLDMSFNSLGSGITELAKQLKCVPRLTMLDLRATNVGEREALALLPLAQALEADVYVSKLQFLYLQSNPLGSGVSVLVQHLTSFPNLEELNVERVMMTNGEIADVTNANRGNVIRTSYHYYNGAPRPEHECPKSIYPVPDDVYSPVRGQSAYSDYLWKLQHMLK
ncbi:NLR family CARD domain-containing protein 4-like [Oculina patagonica]